MRIGQFTLQTPIGTGPHGSAHLAINRELNARAVVKELRGQPPASAEAQERLQRVITRLLTSSHRSVASLQRVFVEGARLYIARDYIEAPALATSPPVAYSVRRISDLLDPVATALEQLHRWRMVHGNLSPTNLFLDHGELRMTDPCVALMVRYLEAESSGPTPSPYTAPETWSQSELTSSADVFSLAALIQYLMGVTVATSPTQHLTRSSVKTRFSFLEMSESAGDEAARTQIDEELPPLPALLKRGLSPRPADRPQTVTDFWREFRRLAAEVPDPQRDEPAVRSAPGAGLSRKPAPFVPAAPSAAPATSTAPPVVSAPAAIVFCPHCHRATVASATVCIACGKPLRPVVERPQPTPQAAAKPGEQVAKSYFHDLGDWLMERGRVAEALRCFERAAQSESKPELLRSLGQAALAQRQYARAQEAFERALKLRSEDSDSRMGLAQSLAARGRYDEALSQYALLQNHPSSSITLAATLAMATTLAMCKRFDLAMKELRSVLQKHPRNVSAHYVLGQVHLQMNNPVGAEEAFQTVLEIDPNHEGASAGMLEAARQRQPAAGAQSTWSDSPLGELDDLLRLLW